MKKNLIYHRLKHMMQNESGSAIVIVAVAFVVILSLAALTIDIGLAYLQSGRLQKAADAAVYSAGRMLPVAQDDISLINAIQDSAIYYAQQNGFSDLTRGDVVLSGLSRGRYTALKVTASKSFEMNFAKVIGVNTLVLTKDAQVSLSPTARAKGVTPLGISRSTLEDYIENGTISHITLKYGSGGSTNGFFGALDLDGTGGGASDYRLWLAYGYPGEVCIGDVLLKENGNMVGPTYSGFSTRYNGCTHFGALTGGEGCTADHFDPECPRVAKVVVYSNNIFTVTVKGFAAFVLEAQSETGYITGSFLNMETAGQASGEGTGTTADYGLYSIKLTE